MGSGRCAAAVAFATPDNTAISRPGVRTGVWVGVLARAVFGTVVTELAVPARRDATLRLGFEI